MKRVDIAVVVFCVVAAVCGILACEYSVHVQPCLIGGSGIEVGKSCHDNSAAGYQYCIKIPAASCDDYEQTSILMCVQCGVASTVELASGCKSGAKAESGCSEVSGAYSYLKAKMPEGDLITITPTGATCRTHRTNSCAGDSSVLVPVPCLQCDGGYFPQNWCRRSTNNPKEDCSSNLPQNVSSKPEC
jgi:hypothetical protein